MDNMESIDNLENPESTFFEDYEWNKYDRKRLKPIYDKYLKGKPNIVVGMRRLGRKVVFEINDRVVKTEDVGPNYMTKEDLQMRFDDAIKNYCNE